MPKAYFDAEKCAKDRTCNPLKDIEGQGGFCLYLSSASFLRFLIVCSSDLSVLSIKSCRNALGNSLHIDEAC